MLLCIAFFVIASLAMLGGCTGSLDFGAVRDRVEEFDKGVAAARLDLEEANKVNEALLDEISRMEEGKKKEDALKDQAKSDRVITSLKTFIEQTEARSDKLKNILDTAEDDADLIRASGREMAPLLPPPWNIVTILGTGLIASLVRARQNRKLGMGVIRSLDNVLDQDMKDNIHQTPAEKKLVDEAQGKRSTLLGI